MEKGREQFGDAAGAESFASIDAKAKAGVDAQSVFDGYISEQEYARQRGVSLRTCQRDRALRKAPPHCLIGKQVWYRVEAIRIWMRERECGFENTRRKR
jgi:hypothetical protein